MGEPLLSGISGYILISHAEEILKERNIDVAHVHAVLREPEQRFSVREGRDVLQSRINLEGHEYLLRVFVDVDAEPAEVVTAYLTSKIGKYWR